MPEVCRNCGIALILGANYCPSCGTKVEIKCAACEAPLSPEFAFCAKCGTKVITSGRGHQANAPLTLGSVKIEAKQDQTKGPGYAVLHLIAPSLPNPEELQFFLSRSDGCDLTPFGWEITSRVPLTIEGIEPFKDGLLLYLGPKVVDHMKDQTYCLKVCSASGDSLSRNFLWRNIASSPQNGLSQPFNMIAKDVNPTLIVGGNATDNKYSKFITDDLFLMKYDDPVLLVELGRRVCNGVGTEKNIMLACTYWEKALALGSADAAFNIGATLENGEIGGTPASPDLASAFKYYKLAADLGDPECKYLVGYWFSIGRGCEQNYYNAEKYLYDSLTAGQKQAVPVLVRIGVIQDIKEALKKYGWDENNICNYKIVTDSDFTMMKILSEHGMASAFSALGIYLYHEQDNLGAARDYWEQGAKMGDNACIGFLTEFSEHPIVVNGFEFDDLSGALNEIIEDGDDLELLWDFLKEKWPKEMRNAYSLMSKEGHRKMTISLFSDCVDNKDKYTVFSSIKKLLNERRR